MQVEVFLSTTPVPRPLPAPLPSPAAAPATASQPAKRAGGGGGAAASGKPRLGSFTLRLHYGASEPGQATLQEVAVHAPAAASATTSPCTGMSLLLEPGSEGMLMKQPGDG